MIKNFLKSLLGQKGQSLVLYAFLVPVMVTLSGTVLDLGWYYLSQSRLQNMADAAVIAGAEVLVNPLKGGDLTDYTYNYFLPSIPNENDLKESKRKTDSGDAEAKNYIAKNLSSSTSWENNEVKDNFNNSELTFTKKLYEKTDDDYKPLYYEVELTEKHHHLFNILNSFDTVISAKAVAKFTTYNEKMPPFYEQMEALKEKKSMQILM